MYPLTICELMRAGVGSSVSVWYKMIFRRCLAHLAPSFSSNTTPLFLSVPAFTVKVSNLVHFQKLHSYSLSVSLLSFVVSPGPLTSTAVLTYDNVILNQHVCVQFFCLHVICVCYK